MREENSKKTIHEILEQAFYDIHKQHGAVVDCVDFDYTLTVTGLVRLASVRVTLESHN